MKTHSDKYYPPSYRSRSFHCPHCGVYAAQHWGILRFKEPPQLFSAGREASLGGTRAEYSVCEHCTQPTLWSGTKFVYPNDGGYPQPNEDMPDEVKKVFHEAGAIVQLSPRSAAALLRIALQMLLKQLGESGDIVKAIKSLDAKGLDPSIRDALHTVRVIGNHAVHPGKIDFDEDIDVFGLFELLNAVTKDLITFPRERQEMYEGLPKGDKDFIAQKSK